DAHPPWSARRALSAYRGEKLLEASSSHVDFGGDDVLLRIPEAARHLSEPAFEDGVGARWVTDRGARVVLAIDAPAGLVLRLRARALETPEPQAMEVVWNGVSVG